MKGSFIKTAHDTGKEKKKETFVHMQSQFPTCCIVGNSDAETEDSGLD